MVRSGPHSPRWSSNLRIGPMVHPLYAITMAICHHAHCHQLSVHFQVLYCTHHDVSEFTYGMVRITNCLARHSRVFDYLNYNLTENINVWHFGDVNSLHRNYIFSLQVPPDRVIPYLGRRWTLLGRHSTFLTWSISQFFCVYYPINIDDKDRILLLLQELSLF